MIRRTEKIILAAASITLAGTFPAMADTPRESAASVMNELGENVQNGWSPVIEEIVQGIEETSGRTFESVAAEEAAKDIRVQIVNYARQFVGNPYQFGGSSLTSGTDCSGFTMRILGNFGIATGRDSRTQAARSRRIAVEDAQPGDLLFYASGGRIDHVALYIGNGQIVHAANERSGITIASAYYRTPNMAGTFLS